MYLVVDFLPFLGVLLTNREQISHCNAWAVWSLLVPNVHTLCVCVSLGGGGGGGE